MTLPVADLLNKVGHDLGQTSPRDPWTIGRRMYRLLQDCVTVRMELGRASVVRVELSLQT